MDEKLPRNSDELKIFISYSSKNQIEAEKLHEMFKMGNIDCFLSTPDLKGGDEWEPIVFQKLMSSNFFVLVLSEDFLNSQWCNHEAGIAYSRYKCDNASLVPVSIDETVLYGIFSGVQRKKFDDFNSLEEFSQIIHDKTFSFKKAIETFKNQQINNIIGELRESENYDESNEIFNKLNTINLSSEHINILLEIALSYSEVSHCNNLQVSFLNTSISMMGNWMKIKLKILRGTGHQFLVNFRFQIICNFLRFVNEFIHHFGSYCSQN